MRERKDSEPAIATGAPVGVVGAGTMGIGVAQCFAEAGYPVVVVDSDPAALGGGPARLRAGVRMAQLLRRRSSASAGAGAGAGTDSDSGTDSGRGAGAGGGTPASSSPSPEARVVWSEKLSDLAPAFFVVECAREKVPVKEEILRQLDQVCGPDTVFASCTSCIPITRLGSVTGRPDRVIGTHFMNPAPLKDAVEVIRAPRTSEQTVRRTVDLLAEIGKQALVIRDAPGFVTNRVLMLTLNEAATVLGEGTADAETVDRIFQDCFGHPMGPLRTADLIGLDTVLDSLDVLREFTGDERFRPCALLARHVAEGSVGRKSGRGFYQYPEQRQRPEHHLVSRGGASHG
ncbi:3-hydroxybutyryl-CoA dehydrogenase [Streptomyces sp. L-9-10]|uniref:3-hydroxyacyl-CoA dehydrogenase family protein n=1 Tax=Streptomyces sp. L-9-10 TaxID=1478131 RepID=UPI0010CE3467|nr:3-hydroxyacyl-CoA dehydrogenase family protein [Streptomyces sp. L-9-10]RYJ31929.1 3-hydroxybutyryl-CoA dehydrogenase [Streptomyces sp. L-9-10]